MESPLEGQPSGPPDESKCTDPSRPYRHFQSNFNRGVIKIPSFEQPILKSQTNSACASNLTGRQISGAVNLKPWTEGRLLGSSRYHQFEDHASATAFAHTSFHLEKLFPLTGTGTSHRLNTIQTDPVWFGPDFFPVPGGGPDLKHCTQTPIGCNQIITLNRDGNGPAPLNIRNFNGVPAPVKSFPLSPIQTGYTCSSSLIKNNNHQNNGTSGYNRPMMCNFCKNNKEVPDIYMNHYLYDPKTKKLTCPVLRKHVCEVCGETGDRAHTLQYCPVNRQKGLQAKVPVLLKTRTITNSTGKIRRN